MSTQEYSIYRDTVLAQTDGANVHAVNGRLAIVLMANEQIWQLEAMVEKAQKEIRRLTRPKV